MSEYIYRLAQIIPAAQRDAANRNSVAMGWGPDSFSVELSPTGAPPATHYGLSTLATQVYIDALTGAAQGQVPDGPDPADVAAVMPVLQTSAASADQDPAAQFDALAGSMGLQRVNVEL